MATKTVNVEVENYDVSTNKWIKEQSILHFNSTLLASGGLRNAYMAYDCRIPGWGSYPMVLKLPKHEEFQGEEHSRKQVVMQEKCIKYAEEYNRHPSITKKIKYVKSRLVKFLYGEWNGKYATIEEYIGENFIKHNTVDPAYDGYALTNRNTPQAFSHFTFEKSNKTEIVVDVQGVGDCYTDPQLYSVSNFNFSDMSFPYGPADWGIAGVANFFRNHRCNAVCRALSLDPIRPLGYDSGTQPHH